MLEILIVWQCCKKIGQIVRDKGRKAGGYQTLAVFSWIGGEIFGTIVGLLLGGDGDGQLLMYGMALFGAAIGMAFAFFIAAIVPDVSTDAKDEWENSAYSCRSCGEQLQPDIRTCPVCGEAT